MSGRPFTSQTGRAAQAARMEHRREASETFERANKPGVYRCACCGERLSGPAKFYTCPRRDVRGIALPEVA